MPGKTFKVTPKHRRFVKEYVNHGNAVAAARHKKVGFSESYVHELLKKPEIVTLIQEAEKKAGLTDELLTRAHVELVQQDTDRSVRLGAVRLGYQLKKKIGADPDAPVSDRVPNIYINLLEEDNGKPESGRRKVSVNSAPDISIQIVD